MAAWNRPVARCADRSGREAPAVLAGTGRPSALPGVPLGPLARRVSFSGRSVTFAIAGPRRAGGGGRGGAVLGDGNPVGAGVSEALEAAPREADKEDIRVYLGLSPGERQPAADYRCVRPFTTPVT